MDYLYFYGCDIKPSSGQAGRTSPAEYNEEICIYPENTPGVQIMKFRAGFDPTIDLTRARRIFESTRRKSGIFFFDMYLPDLLEGAKLDKLRQFISYLKKVRLVTKQIE